MGILLITGAQLKLATDKASKAELEFVKKELLLKNQIIDYASKTIVAQEKLNLTLEAVLQEIAEQIKAQEAQPPSPRYRLWQLNYFRLFLLL